MLRLGHIRYSNCIPVHALLLEGDPGPDLELRWGTPAELNAELAAGRIDVAPSSSIEYARHADHYTLLPDLSISSTGPVGSILLEGGIPPEELDGREIALPTASATSVVLLRLLLERRFGVRPRYRWFEQSPTADPLGAGADAALWIGDLALRRTEVSPLPLLDLGAEWTRWTGLPFVFAVWQSAVGPARAAEVRALHARLLDSREWFQANLDPLAARYAPEFGLTPERLAAYWRNLEFGFDERFQQGLKHFFALAADLGEVPAAPALRWIDRART